MHSRNDSTADSATVYIEIVRRRRFLVVLLLSAAVACSPAPEDYATRIAGEREAKDQMFRQVGGPNSPIRPGELDKFVPLSYFPIDESYAVPAQLEPSPERVVITMPTSTGTLREVDRVGTLKFNLKGQPLKLTAFREKGQRQLFVPFSDLTSGTETYQAGRYMNLEPTPSGIYIVDFNVAYIPYCYYNAEYECPLPPAENRLAVPIRAGERMRKADTTIDR
jgi:uncharacterized protein (DUF1684 family)